VLFEPCFETKIVISRKWEKHPGTFYEMEFSQILNTREEDHSIHSIHACISLRLTTYDSPLEDWKRASEAHHPLTSPSPTSDLESPRCHIAHRAVLLSNLTAPQLLRTQTSNSFSFSSRLGKLRILARRNGLNICALSFTHSHADLLYSGTEVQWLVQIGPIHLLAK
jgi:hypothetical protein